MEALLATRLISAQHGRALAAAAQAGDEQARNQLLALLARELLPLASALTGGSDEADELLQDTLSRVFERLRQLQEPQAIFSWAKRILLHRFIDSRRLVRRRAEVPLELASFRIAAPPREDVIALREAVTGLARSERALLVMHYWLGLTLAECAQELNLPVGTVKSRLNAALTKLRRKLGEVE